MKPKPPQAAARVGARDRLGTIAATFLLRIANPVTILSFAAMFAGLGPADAPGAINAVIVVARVLVGSLLWWCVPRGAVATVRRRLPEGFAAWVFRLSGLVLIGFGLYAPASLLRLATRQVPENDRSLAWMFRPFSPLRPPSSSSRPAPARTI